ncbi:MAG: hypothetical protein QXE81_06615, partial [Desulfurococcaceae archaeon]
IDFPVISIDSKTAENMLSQGGLIKGDSSLKRSTGFIIIGYLNNSGERYIHLISHHDSIIGDIKHSSTSLLLNILRRITRERLPFNITLISYTAREIGDAEFTSYHYTWGERYLLRLLENRGELENILLSISLGPLSGYGDLLAIAHPLIHNILVDHGIEVRDNHFTFESHPYMEYGIPSVVFADQESLLYRNSTLEPNSIKLSSTIDKISRIINNILKKHIISIDDVNSVRKYVYQEIGEQPVEVRTTVTRALDLSRLYTKDISMFLKVFTKVSYMYFQASCIDPLNTYMDYSILSPLSRNNITVLDELLSTCKHDLLVKTNACESYISTPSVAFKQEFKKNIIENIVKYLSSLLNYEITKKTCLKKLERGESVKESNWNR